MTAEQSLRAAEFTARHWHQTALGSGHIPFVHAIACISAAIAGETDPNQLGLDPSVHDAFRAALGEPDDLIRERCPHCPETLPRNRVDDHVTTAHADLPPCTASIHVRTNDTTYRCVFRVGHNGEYGALHASAYAKRDGRYVWDDEHDGAIPHREAETDANGWTLKDDGIWTLPVDGGTVLMTRQTTPEERARFAEQWARDTKTKPNGSGVDEPLPAPCASCIAGAHDPNYHRRRRGLPPPRIVPAEHCGHLPPQASFTTPPTECVLRPGHQGSHADDRGSRWWPTPETTTGETRQAYADAVECAIGLNVDCGGTAGVHRVRDAVLAVRDQEMEGLRGQIADLQRNNSALGRDAVRDAERSMQLAVTLQQVLGHFVHKGHPGEPCLQTGWISVKTVDRWRAVLNPPKGGSK